MSFKSHKQSALGDVTTAVAKGIFQAAADFVLEANAKAPVDTGQLKQSGKVVPKTLLTIAVQFSRSSDTGYNVAARMEYDESLNHPKGGQAHFLQSTADSIRPRMPDYVRRYSVK